MMGNQKVLIIWVWMLLWVSLYPWAHCKRGRGFGGRSKGVGVPFKAPPSQSKGRQGVKLAGAAAAGALGGAAIGYGLGSLGRPRYGYGHDGSSEENRRYYPDGQGYYNRSDGSNVPHVPCEGLSVLCDVTIVMVFILLGCF
uniref:Shadow of prion protein 2 n=2 Tax=Cyprinus carpio TaxID=7962 RepID=A0A9J8BK03_CYPCA